MSTPLVSVTMIVRDAERFLIEAIESVLQQTLSDIELIIIDFGSTDTTPSICSAYAQSDVRIRLESIAPCGLAEARNAACHLARGRYIAVMDADDRCLPDRLRLQVRWMEAHPDYAIVGGSTDWIDAVGNPLGIHTYPADPDEICIALETKFPFCHPAQLLRRDAFLAVGGYRKPFVFAHDYDLALRVSERYRCSNIPEVILNYRIHPFQVSFLRQEKQTLCRLAAQASHRARLAGHADPLDTIEEIDESIVLALGMHEPDLRSIQVADARNWMRGMFAAGENGAILDLLASTDLLHAPVERWQIADLRLMRAKVLWRLGQHAASITDFVHAFIVSPRVAGRPLRHLASILQARGAQ